MKQSQFKILAGRSSGLLASDPKAHARRLAVFALLGLFYPYAFALACLACAALCVWGTFIYENGILAALGGLALGFLIRFCYSLYFAMRPPDGVPLKEKDAPALFEELRSVAKSMGARMPDNVLVDGAFNAGAASLSSRWLLPGQRNDYLILGLPLMEGLDMREFRSVLAHEMAHFSLSHPASTRLSWRAFQTWLRIDRQLASSGGLLSKLMLGYFANWYLPRIDALLSATSRKQEFEADAMGATVGGREAAARALLLHAILAKRLMLDVTKPFWDKARTLPEPPSGFFKELARNLSIRPTQKELEKQFESLSRILPGESDSHPLAAERLAKFGFAQSPPELPLENTSAAEKLLGDNKAAIYAKVEERWLAEARPTWTRLHESSQTARRALSQMLNVNFKEASSLPAMLQRAQLLEAACGSDAALRPLEDIVDEHPDCAEAKFNLGRIKLSLGKTEGAALMRTAMEADPSLIRPGFEPLADFYRSEGLAADHATLLELRETAPQPSSAKERKPSQTELKSSWRLDAHKLKQEELSELLRILAENGNVAQAFLTEVRPPEGAVQEPFHALIVVRRFSLLGYRGEDDSKLASELATPLAKLQTLKILPFDKCPLPVKMKLKLLKDSQIFKS